MERLDERNQIREKIDKKLNIVIIGTAYPFRGGLATFNQRLAQQFQAEGHHVELLTFTTQYPSFLFPGKTQLSSDSAPKGLSIRRAFSSCNPFTWIKVGRQLCKQRPDLVICCYWMAFFAPAYATIERIARRNGHTRCIALVHNMIPHEPTLLDRMFAPSFVRNTDGFVALSKSVVADIEEVENKTPRAGRRKPKMFNPHPIYDHYGTLMSKYEACATLGLDPKYDYMLFFGLVRAYKGLDLLIDALGKVKDELPNLHLLIAGEFYEEEQLYRKQMQAAGLTVGNQKPAVSDPRVILRNEFIPDDDLRKYFGAADLIVQPYKSATQSGVTQVAFHFEKPMLVTNVGGLSEIVHHGKMGYAVEPESEAIVHALRDYYTQHREQAFIEYLRKEKDKYSWDKMTSTFFRLYDKL